VRLQDVVVHVAALQQFAQQVPHLLADTNDIKPGDSLEVFEVEERARTL
jgi:translation initiation factor IF-2